MFRTPKQILCAQNNVISVGLPLTNIDIDQIVDKVADLLGHTSVEDLENIDIDTNGLEDGSLLIYNSLIKKWQTSKYLDRQRLDAGEY